MLLCQLPGPAMCKPQNKMVQKSLGKAGKWAAQQAGQ